MLGMSVGKGVPDGAWIGFHWMFIVYWLAEPK
jgi:hypothetical protein